MMISGDIQKFAEAIQHTGIDAIDARLEIMPEKGNAHRLQAQCGNMRKIFTDLAGVETSPEPRAGSGGEITNA